MPRSIRKSQKAGGACSYVNTDRRRAGSRKGSRKMRRSQRAGGCGYTGDKRRAGVRRSQRAGGNCHCTGHGHSHGKHPKRNRSRKAKSQKRKGFVVVCPAPDGSCRKRM